MARKSIYLILALALFALQLGVHASSLTSYLSTYISNSTIASATFQNATFNSNSYIVMHLTNGTYIVIANSSGTYSLVTNATLIQTILNPLLSSRFQLNVTTLAQLNTSMHTAMAYGYKNLSDCAVELGLVNGNTCTLANGAMHARQYLSAPRF